MEQKHSGATAPPAEPPPPPLLLRHSGMIGSLAPPPTPLYCNVRASPLNQPPHPPPLPLPLPRPAPVPPTHWKRKHQERRNTAGLLRNRTCVGQYVCKWVSAAEGDARHLLLPPHEVGTCESHETSGRTAEIAYSWNAEGLLGVYLLSYTVSEHPQTFRASKTPTL